MIKIKSPGAILYSQQRIGKQGKPFMIYKFRTMIECVQNLEVGTITVKDDKRITGIGKLLRKWKLDELPTLVNVVKGDMSLVGPRPDVPGYADKLLGDDRRILEVRPGITSPAALKYANEEELLANIKDPMKFNNEILYMDKVQINLNYIDNINFLQDIIIILKTIFRTNY